MFSHNGLFSLLFLAVALIIVIGAYLYYLSTQRKFSFVTSPARIIIPLAIILTATELVVMDLISFVFNQHISITESLIDASILLITTFPLLYLWLRQQSQQISVIVQNIVDAVIVINEKGEIEYFNPAAEKIFGYSTNEILGQKVNILMPEPHQTNHDQYLQEYLSTQVPHVINKGRVNLTALKKNKEEFPIYIAINNMNFYGRKFFVASIQDITEQKKIEEKIKLSEEKYRALFEHNADAIFVADTQTGMIVDTNHKAAELIGRSVEEILTMHQTQLHPPDETEFRASRFKKVVTNPVPTTLESEVIHKNGKRIPVELSTAFYTDPEGKQRIIGVFRDISERKDYEEALEKIKDAALDASRAKSEFLTNMSHEIRTPMNTTLGIGELLKETELTKDQKRYVDMFQKSAEHLLDLINDILDLSKIESGYMELESTDLNLLSIIEHVQSILSPKAKEKGIELLIDIDPAIPAYLIGDPQRIKQILINLVGNALKFTPKGSITVNAKLENTGNKNVKLLFEVKDTGIGIPPDKLNRLFKNFSQVDSSTTRQYGGTGLGLVISKNFVEMMNGNIWVKSEVGKGSSFFFDIELEISLKTKEEKTEKDKKEKIGIKLKSSKLSILLVEDSDDNRQLIRLYFKDHNFIIDEAENGEIALDKMINNNYDAVLMDIQMPVMDGYEATRLYRQWEIKEKERSIPIIGISANAFKDDREKALRAGCTEYLTKPVRKHQLLETLESTLTNVL